MKRVAHPVCCCCGSKNPDFESEQFSIRVCRLCLRDFADYLVRIGAGESLDNNPLATELFADVFVWAKALESATHYTIISRDMVFTKGYGYRLVRRFSCE